MPLNAWQIFVLERASDLCGKNVEDIIADQVEVACRRFAPKVNAKELLDFAELFVESVDPDSFEDDSPVIELRNKANVLIDFIADKFPDLIESDTISDTEPKIETEQNWLDEVIKKAKEHKHDPNGPKDIRDK